MNSSEYRCRMTNSVFGIDGFGEFGEKPAACEWHWRRVVKMQQTGAACQMASSNNCHARCHMGYHVCRFHDNRASVADRLSMIYHTMFFLFASNDRPCVEIICFIQGVTKKWFTIKFLNRKTIRLFVREFRRLDVKWQSYRSRNFNDWTS